MKDNLEVSNMTREQKIKTYFKENPKEDEYSETDTFGNGVYLINLNGTCLERKFTSNNKLFYRYDYWVKCFEKRNGFMNIIIK